MNLQLYPLTGAEDFAERLAYHGGFALGAAEQRRFPDGESYVRLLDECGAEVAIVAQLDRPDEKLLPLVLLADTLRDLGARRIGLIAPYLPYMRQDTRFRPGEGITSRYFARLLCSHVDWLLTVDPHLHRYASLDEIYAIPSAVVPAAPLLADWIGAEVVRPLLIGPDSESEQWVREVARYCNAPHRVLRKVRYGDRDVRIEVPDMPADVTPVLIDDIISSGHTMAETVRQLRAQGLPAPVCAAVHGIFADGAVAALAAAGAGAVVTCNGVAHASNAIDLAPALAAAVPRLARVMPAAAGPA